MDWVYIRAALEEMLRELAREISQLEENPNTMANPEKREALMTSVALESHVITAIVHCDRLLERNGAKGGE